MISVSSATAPEEAPGTPRLPAGRSGRRRCLWREQLTPDVQLQAGTIRYQDTGGSGPVVVLLHGLAMDGSLWRHVVHPLRDEYRCVVPTLPLGGHRRPMRADADLSPGGIAPAPGRVPGRPDLREVTLVGNDSGLFQLTAAQHPQRIARLVICSCEAFDNFPRVCQVAPSRWPAGCRVVVERESYFDPTPLLRAILTRPRAWPVLARTRTRQLPRPARGS